MDVRSKLSVAALVIAVLAQHGCCFEGTPQSPPPPPVSAAPPSVVTPPPAPTAVVAAPLVPTTVVAPSPSSVELARDQLVCGAAAQCCAAAGREARMVARMQGYDPRDDPRGYDPRDDYESDRDPRRDPRLREPARLASGCRQLRSGTDLGATRCEAQIEGMRRAFREARVSIPSVCTVPDAPATPSP